MLSMTDPSLAAIKAFNKQYNPDYRQQLLDDGFAIELRIESNIHKERIGADGEVVTHIASVVTTVDEEGKRTVEVTEEPLLCTDMQWWLGFHGDVAGCFGSVLKMVQIFTGEEVTGVFTRASI